MNSSLTDNRGKNDFMKEMNKENQFQFKSINSITPPQNEIKNFIELNNTSKRDKNKHVSFSILHQDSTDRNFRESSSENFNSRHILNNPKSSYLNSVLSESLTSSNVTDFANNFEKIDPSGNEYDSKTLNNSMNCVKSSNYQKLCKEEYIYDYPCIRKNSSMKNHETLLPRYESKAHDSRQCTECQCDNCLHSSILMSSGAFLGNESPSDYNSPNNKVQYNDQSLNRLMNKSCLNKPPNLVNQCSCGKPCPRSASQIGGKLYVDNKNYNWIGNDEIVNQLPASVDDFQKGKKFEVTIQDCADATTINNANSEIPFKNHEIRQCYKCDNSSSNSSKSNLYNRFNEKNLVTSKLFSSSKGEEKKKDSKICVSEDFLSDRKIFDTECSNFIVNKVKNRIYPSDLDETVASKNCCLQKLGEKYLPSDSGFDNIIEETNNNNEDCVLKKNYPNDLSNNMYGCRYLLDTVKHTKNAGDSDKYVGTDVRDCDNGYVIDYTNIHASKSTCETNNKMLPYFKLSKNSMSNSSRAYLDANCDVIYESKNKNSDNAGNLFHNPPCDEYVSHNINSDCVGLKFMDIHGNKSFENNVAVEKLQESLNDEIYHYDCKIPKDNYQSSVNDKIHDYNGLKHCNTLLTFENNKSKPSLINKSLSLNFDIGKNENPVNKKNNLIDSNCSQKVDRHSSDVDFVENNCIQDGSSEFSVVSASGLKQKNATILKNPCVTLFKKFFEKKTESNIEPIIKNNMSVTNQYAKNDFSVPSSTTGEISIGDNDSYFRNNMENNSKYFFSSPDDDRIYSKITPNNLKSNKMNYSMGSNNIGVVCGIPCTKTFCSYHSGGDFFDANAYHHDYIPRLNICKNSCKCYHHAGNMHVCGPNLNSMASGTKCKYSMNNLNHNYFINCNELLFSKKPAPAIGNINSESMSKYQKSSDIGRDNANNNCYSSIGNTVVKYEDDYHNKGKIHNKINVKRRVSSSFVNSNRLYINGGKTSDAYIGGFHQNNYPEKHIIHQENSGMNNNYNGMVEMNHGIQDNNLKNNAYKVHNFFPKSSLSRSQLDWQIPDRYEIKYLIGTGSYGHVCEAFDKVAQRVVAIKKIHQVFEDLIDCKRILREISILNRLSHDNVVEVLDIIAPQDIYKFDDLYVVLEIADSDFKKLFRSPIYLTEIHIKTLLYNLLIGIKYIHSCGIYHRDLKPANCLVNQDCSVKICDFGLARTVDISDDSGQNINSTKLGEDTVGIPRTKNLKRKLTGHVVTRWYRAPELILLQEAYTEAIDVWSIGCIFAELLNMMKDNARFCNERGPLFPGSSCFPLSPDQKNSSDYKFHTRGNRDQLNMIFNIIGTPSEEDTESLEKEDAKKYIKIFHKREGIDMRQKFPGSSAEAIDLLERMLVFNPKKRITVEECLNHCFFKEIRNRNVEIVAEERAKLPFDDWTNMNEPHLRYAFLNEIQRYHPELKIPENFFVDINRVKINNNVCK